MLCQLHTWLPYRHRILADFCKSYVGDLGQLRRHCDKASEEKYHIGRAATLRMVQKLLE